MDFLNSVQQIDLECVRWVREYIACPFLDAVMPVITLIGEDGILWIAITLVMLMFGKTRKTGFVMALSLSLGFLIGNMTLKPLVARPRPYSIDTSAYLLIDGLSDFSFPSGHTLACFECAVSLLLCKYRRTGSIALFAAFLVAFSRVYLYVHFPTDIIAGAILGTLFAFAAWYIVNKLYSKFQKSKSL